MKIIELLIPLLITSITVIAPLLAKMASDRKQAKRESEDQFKKMINLITDNDNKQDAILQEYGKTIEKINHHLDKQENIELLKFKIEKAYLNYVSVTTDLDNAVLVLLKSGKDSIIEFGTQMLISSIPYKQEEIERELQATIDKQKMIVVSHMPNVDDNCNNIDNNNFLKMLRLRGFSHDFARLLVTLIYRIKKGDYNGESNKRLIDSCYDYMIDMFKEVVTVYRIMKKE